MKSKHRFAVAPKGSGSDANGCVVDAQGATLCLPPGSEASVQVAAGSLPSSIEECGSSEAAMSLLQRVERGEAVATPAQLETGLVHAASRHWWTAARATVEPSAHQWTFEPTV